ncbi:MAG TPA: hypothetical protein VJR58_25260 [Vineibacter sp.]|nr:hypothetical protein [Vineibacter sp.]
MTKAINSSESGLTPMRDSEHQPDRFAVGTSESGGRILAFPGVPAAQFAAGAYAAPAFPSWLRRFFADLS